MAKIAILGFGTVGSGVYEVLCRNAAGVSRRAGEPVEVKYILDPKDFSAHPAAQLFIKNFDTIPAVILRCRLILRLCCLGITGCGIACLLPCGVLRRSIYAAYKPRASL